MVASCSSFVRSAQMSYAAWVKTFALLLCFLIDTTRAGKIYKRIGSGTREEAKTKCTAIGWHLPLIESLQDMNDLKAFRTNDEDTWLVYMKKMQTLSAKSEDYEPPGIYENGFESGQPSHEDEICTYLKSGLRDIGCDRSKNIYCEKKAPTTAAPTTTPEPKQETTPTAADDASATTMDNENPVTSTDENLSKFTKGSTMAPGCKWILFDAGTAADGSSCWNHAGTVFILSVCLLVSVTGIAAAETIRSKKETAIVNG